ncbi:SDR family NAD(P)-dependent oxidoreductase [Babesia caballi]|uniref:SDR family NAD(P)-dependent oxidoreductase n=1 Tax=Babesia caballi TaxID=5871 RepID=A0AAV4M0N3_BABCB|nr:SDR family NAD(P)-dependent oxidoreductase [Babesia caballi]
MPRALRDGSRVAGVEGTSEGVEAALHAAVDGGHANALGVAHRAGVVDGADGDLGVAAGSARLPESLEQVDLLARSLETVAAGGHQAVALAAQGAQHGLLGVLGVAEGLTKGLLLGLGGELVAAHGLELVLELVQLALLGAETRHLFVELGAVGVAKGVEPGGALPVGLVQSAQLSVLGRQPGQVGLEVLHVTLERGNVGAELAGFFGGGGAGVVHDLRMVGRGEGRHGVEAVGVAGERC